MKQKLQLAPISAISHLDHHNYPPVSPPFKTAVKNERGLSLKHNLNLKNISKNNPTAYF